MTDERLNKLLKQWPDEALPDGLLDRVVREALAHPQRQNWTDFALWLGEQIFGQRRSMPAFRCAVLLICVVAGIAIGNHQLPHHGGPDIFNMQDLTLADDFIGINETKGDL